VLPIRRYGPYGEPRWCQSDQEGHQEETMHPNLAQGIAAERRADMRRNADAYRAARDYSPASPAARTVPAAHQRAGRGRIRLVPGQRRKAAHEHMAFAADTDRTPGHRATEQMLVLPDGRPESAESLDLCSAGR
jgi:hypothetical protein